VLSLGQIQGSGFQSASGYCTTSQDYFDIVNEVIPRLLNRGDWPGSVMPIQVQVRNGCVTWFRYVAQVRKAHTCRGHIPVQSVWGDFLDYKEGRRYHEWGHRFGAERRFVNQWQSPTYNDMYGPNCTVRLYVDLPQDVGTTCTIFGTDNNNQPLQTTNPDGSNSLGQTFTVQLQPGPGGNAYWGSTSTFVSRIDRVVVGATQGMKRLYSYDSVQNALLDLAVYEPNETNPAYLRQQVEGSPRGQWSCSGCCPETIIALVKLRFTPVAVPTDGLIFLEGAQGAIKHAIRARRREDANDSKGALDFWKLAVEELSRYQEDYEPQDQLPVENNVMGGGTMYNRCF
jgi:hypothetical protein